MCLGAFLRRVQKRNLTTSRSIRFLSQFRISMSYFLWLHGQSVLPQSPIFIIKSAHPALYKAHRRYPDSQLGPGSLTAHRRSHLVLLHSCPDTVHEVLLRKTQTSTPLIRGSPASPYPRRDITSAGADCRYRAPLSPRLRGNFIT